MIKEPQADVSELTRLRGISIGMTDNEQAFLIFSYDESQGNEKALVLVCWSLVGGLYTVCGLIIWLTLQEYL
ncbi:MAG TPA: hypothetical protein VK738_15100 [Terriglobales bacterium]|jgi:hypothetical protein|nr:hypothetical protein [Terriglobales bacterium]